MITVAVDVMHECSLLLRLSCLEWILSDVVDLRDHILDRRDDQIIRCLRKDSRSTDEE